MDHLATLLKIIEGGIASNSSRVLSYSKLLAERLVEDGDKTSAEKIQRLLENPPQSTLYPSGAQALPVDKDSRYSLADESEPSQNGFIALDQMVEASVGEFLSFVDNASLLNEAGVGISPFMLIYGPPGCGKSQLAGYVASQLKLPLLTARCDALVSSLLGSTSKNIRNLFEHAANRPCVLFLDEFDALAKARDDQHEVGELKRVVVSLLQNIDQLPKDTILIAATNHEALLDSAVWRRFDYRIQMKLPNENVREKLIERFLQGYEYKNIKNLVAITEGFNGAIIRQVCEAAVRTSVLAQSNIIDEKKALIKVAQIKYQNIIYSDQSHDEKIKALKKENTKLFTTRLLNELFGVSTGKISKLINAAS